MTGGEKRNRSDTVGEVEGIVSHSTAHREDGKTVTKT